jgi:hypothetical protein
MKKQGIKASKYLTKENQTEEEQKISRAILGRVNKPSDMPDGVISKLMKAKTLKTIDELIKESQSFDYMSAATTRRIRRVANRRRKFLRSRGKQKPQNKDSK